MTSNSNDLPIQGRYAKARLAYFRIEEAGLTFHIEAAFNVSLENGEIRNECIGPYRKELEEILSQSGEDLLMEAYNKLPSEFK